ncbi:MAG: choice-of-anchor Q domain-containing protein [Acidiferrobacterales bacterium]
MTNASGTSNGVPFTVRAGNIFFVSPAGTGSGSAAAPMPPSAVYASIQPGNTYYFHAGTYGGSYGETTWGTNNFALGANKSGVAGDPIAFVGYPGETATFQSSGDNITFENASGYGNYYTISNLVFVGGSSTIFSGISDSGGVGSGVAGGANIRVIGNTHSATYTGNTMTGILATCNNGWKILGNQFENTGTNPPINNNHGLYVLCGASNVEVGWNYFHDLMLGHVIQVHTDGNPPYTFSNILIHDNVITATNPANCRGINIGNTSAASYGAIYNNILYNVGQNFSGIAIYGGSWKVYNNTLYGINASPGMIWLSNQNNDSQASAEIVNNILYSDGSSPYVTINDTFSTSPSTITLLSNNLYYNDGPVPAKDTAGINANPLFVDEAIGDFHLLTGSLAIDHGSSVVNTVVTTDHDGNPRSMGPAFDIGAYESIGPSLPVPQNFKVSAQ